jgi:hypothetical protein
MSEPELVRWPGRAPRSRIDAALDTMAGRLGAVLLALDDENSGAFLASLGPPPPAGADGGVLPLPHGRPQPVDRLVAALGLSALDRDLLVLALLGHRHEGVAAILRGLHPQGRPEPTLGLAGTLAEHGVLAGAASRAELRAGLAGSVLLRAGAVAVEGDGPLPERTLRPAACLWEALAGLGGWPAGIRADPRPTPDWGLDRWRASPVVRAATRAVAERAAVTVLAVGDRPAALAGRLAAVVRAAGATPVLLRAPLDGAALRTVLLLGIVRDVVPVVAVEAVAADVPVADVPLPLLLAAPAPVTTGARPLLTLPSGPLERDDRLAALRAAVPELPVGDVPLGPASLEPGDLAMAVEDVRAQVVLTGPVRLEELRRRLTATVDARTAGSVPAGAVLVHPQASWADLVLPADPAAQLHEAVDRMRAREVVLGEWGFPAGRTGAGGLRLLFTGPPGTGKTLAAEVIAAELGRDLLVVDISRLVSKWIGETEKNLAAVFDAAERGGAALFFDEADALFGRRTEVGDARDRYANLETAYLLSRLERFDGIAVLASNLRQNIDPAFGRRIEFVVPFDPPDEDDRLRLWRLHLPPGAPVAEDLPLAAFAALYEVPGALIRNAALAAGFLAAAGPGRIAVDHLVHALRREYAKAGQAFPGPPPCRPAEPPLGKGAPR